MPNIQRQLGSDTVTIHHHHAMLSTFLQCLHVTGPAKHTVLPPRGEGELRYAAEHPPLPRRGPADHQGAQTLLRQLQLRLLPAGYLGQ